MYDYNQHYGYLWELKTDHMLPEAKRDGKPIFAMLQFKLHAECTRFWQKFSKAVIYMYAVFNSVPWKLKFICCQLRNTVYIRIIND